MTDIAKIRINDAPSNMAELFPQGTRVERGKEWLKSWVGSPTIRVSEDGKVSDPIPVADPELIKNLYDFAKNNGVIIEIKYLVGSQGHTFIIDPITPDKGKAKKSVSAEVPLLDEALTKSGISKRAQKVIEWLTNPATKTNLSISFSGTTSNDFNGATIILLKPKTKPKAEPKSKVEPPKPAESAPSAVAVAPTIAAAPAESQENVDLNEAVKRFADFYHVKVEDVEAALKEGAGGGLDEKEWTKLGLTNFTLLRNIANEMNTTGSDKVITRGEIGIFIATINKYARNLGIMTAKAEEIYLKTTRFEMKDLDAMEAESTEAAKELGITYDEKDPKNTTTVGDAWKKVRGLKKETPQKRELIKYMEIVLKGAKNGDRLTRRQYDWIRRRIVALAAMLSQMDRETLEKDFNITEILTRYTGKIVAKDIVGYYKGEEAKKAPDAPPAAVDEEDAKKKKLEKLAVAVNNEASVALKPENNGVYIVEEGSKGKIVVTDQKGATNYGYTVKQKGKPPTNGLVSATPTTLELGVLKLSEEPYEIEFFALNSDAKPAAIATIIKVKVVKQGMLPTAAKPAVSTAANPSATVMEPAANPGSTTMVASQPKPEPATPAAKPAAAEPKTTPEPAKPAASADPQPPAAPAEKPAAAAGAAGEKIAWVVSNPEEPAKPATKPAK